MLYCPFWFSLTFIKVSNKHLQSISFLSCFIFNISLGLFLFFLVINQFVVYLFAHYISFEILSLTAGYSLSIFYLVYITNVDKTHIFQINEVFS
jgi:hypothetical protein